MDLWYFSLDPGFEIILYNIQKCYVLQEQTIILFCSGFCKWIKYLFNQKVPNLPFSAILLFPDIWTVCWTPSLGLAPGWWWGGLQWGQHARTQAGQSSRTTPASPSRCSSGWCRSPPPGWRTGCRWSCWWCSGGEEDLYNSHDNKNFLLLGWNLNKTKSLESRNKLS